MLQFFSKTIIAGMLFFNAVQAPASEALLDESLVRVRLEKNLDVFEVEGTGFQISSLLSPIKSFEKVSIPKKEKIKITVSRKNKNPVWQVERVGRVTELASPFLAIQALDMRDGRQALPTQILLSANKKSQLDVIGVLPLKKYLVGVVAGEMPLGWPREALKAQVIAARSYAFAIRKTREKQSFHLESTVLDQVFSRASLSEEKRKKAESLIEETAGMILQDSKGRVLKAYYHSDCGGHPSSEKAVWGAGSAVRAMTGDASCPVNPKATWSLNVPVQELSVKLAQFLKLKNPELINSITASRPTLLDRVSKLKVVWESGKTAQLLANDFRGLLGFDRMKSTQFEIKKSEDQWVFEGRGFGHGVGLCQWGARHRALTGEDFREILKNYYPVAEISAPIDVAPRAHF